MEKLRGKTALVTGASSGIGESTVEALLAEGAKVYAAARRTDRMKGLEGKGAVVVRMDVTDETSLVSVVDSILKKEGSIDILVNNAGYGSYGALEDVPLKEARRQFEVNIFGLARVTQLVLPKMRETRYGKIVNISSMGGKMYSPFGAWYHATKYALEGLTDCLRLEAGAFGIDAIIVEPGGIATEWGAIAADNLRKTSGSGAYAAQATAASERTAKLYSSGGLSDPSIIAKVIVKAVTAARPRTRYAAGYGAKLALFLRKWLSDRQFDWVISKAL